MRIIRAFAIVDGGKSDLALSLSIYTYMIMTNIFLGQKADAHLILKAKRGSYNAGGYAVQKQHKSRK
jgi:hypothetical protein